MLHLTNAAISLDSKGKGHVYAKLEGKKYVIAVLESDK